MPILKVHRPADIYLEDKSLSLSTKKSLTLVLTNNITNVLDVENLCTDSKEDIKNTLLELKNNHYIKYNLETNMLEANAMTYDQREKELAEYEI